MNELKTIATATLPADKSLVKIIIDDEEYIKKLPALAKYDYVIIVYIESEPERELLEKIFGPEACRIDKVRLLSVNGNELEVVNFTTSYIGETVQIRDIHPFYPEDEELTYIDINGNVSPDFAKIFEKRQARELY